jgi:hypothetical protein
MDLIREHEGTEEWGCPDCGRHMLVNWNPKFKRTILESGDPSMGHTAFKNNVKPEDLVEDRFNGILPEREVIEPADEARLAPWVSWMDKNNYSNLWNNSAQ